MRLTAFAWAAMLLAGTQSVAHSARSDRRVAMEAAGLRQLRADDVRVATIAFRIAAANNPICLDHAPLSGLALHDARQYDAIARPIATDLFKLKGGPAVLAIVPGGPADLAGVREDDAVAAINGKPVTLASAKSDDKASYADVEKVTDALDAAFAAGPVELGVQRDGVPLTLHIMPVMGCASTVQLVPSGRLNAGADGKTVTITTATLEYAGTDDELAVVIGHEMAHNALRHRKTLDAQHVAKGFLSNFGKNASRIQMTERQADYVGLYMMARAGYDIAAAPAFWHRYARDHGLGILGGATHPRASSRERDLATYVVEIEHKRRDGKPIIPDQSPI